MTFDATAFALALPVPAAAALAPRGASALPRTAFAAAPLAARPPARPPARIAMQDADVGADDDTPSDTYVPAAEAAAPARAAGDASKRASLMARLLQLAAVTARGQLATDAQAAAIDDLVLQLEEANPSAAPVETDLLDGSWTLVYTSARLFSASPLLAAAAAPLLQVGQVRQRVAVGDGALTTEVDVVAFPGTSATVASTARVTPVGDERLELVVEKTSVTGGKLLNSLDLGGIAFDIPVEQILTRLRNTAPETYFDTYYLDDKLRISRCKNGKLYIYTRLE